MEERTIGWYQTFEDAEKSMKLNASVICDYVPKCLPYYPHALIECVPEGPYGAMLLDDTDKAVRFYRWKDNRNHDGGTYVRMKRPKSLRGTVGFTMG